MGINRYRPTRNTKTHSFLLITNSNDYEITNKTKSYSTDNPDPLPTRRCNGTVYELRWNNCESFKKLQAPLEADPRQRALQPLHRDQTLLQAENSPAVWEVIAMLMVIIHLRLATILRVQANAL